MSIARIPFVDIESAYKRFRMLDITIEGGEYEVDNHKDGLILLVPIEVEANKIVQIELPHNITVIKNALLISLPPDLLNSGAMVSCPSILSTGWEGKPVLNIRAKKALSTVARIKLHVITID